jgi:hypothetical protein
MKIKRVLVSCIGLLLLVTTACGENISSTSDIPSTFDPAVLVQRTGPENSVQMTFADYEKIAPSVWNEETRIMTIPLPFVFKGGQSPILYIEKVQDPLAEGTLDIVNVGGLEQGVAFISNFDGTIEASRGASKNLTGFFVRTNDSQGNNVSLYFKTTGLNSMIEFDYNVAGDMVRSTIKKGDIIGYLLKQDKHYAFNGQVQITGRGPSLEALNLATTPEGKLILVIK